MSPSRSGGALGGRGALEIGGGNVDAEGGGDALVSASSTTGEGAGGGIAGASSPHAAGRGVRAATSSHADLTGTACGDGADHGSTSRDKRAGALGPGLDSAAPSLSGGPAPPAMAQPVLSSGDALQAQAVASFRQARFSEAYGRFIGLADAGHAPAATLALWMYLNGPSLFGKDWDSTQEQLAAWAQLARQPVPALVGRGYTPATLP